MQSKLSSFNIIKAVWLTLSVGVAIFGLLAQGDSSVVASYLIWLLTLPSGIAVYFGVSFALSFIAKESLGFGGLYDFSLTLFTYLLAIIFGYFQWFIVVPKEIYKLKKNKTSRAWFIVYFILIIFSVYLFLGHIFPSVD
ncbi:hypothetical protein AZI87_16355 [Bdellovibrio bacteriovorus]|uniref:Uncharacterized protein n=1 Tax=Bdellovibrio bacteriovorus TaxID=959 RepID=A0A162FZ93_BDEBC|nr:hypothetical protein [Bdellovibrio bacteriovorus]KYG62842.1 hypothetical protein AZI87_16355 [Bdellovibrio bacteriovorus]